MSAQDFNPLHAFAHAEKLRTSVGILNEGGDGFEITTTVVDELPSVPYPMLILAALGTEIFLKCIRRLHNLNIADHHNLWDHYKSIYPAEHKKAIEQYYEDVIRQCGELDSVPKGFSNPPELKTILKKQRHIFNTLRYMYEEGEAFSEQGVINMGLVMEAARRYALELLVRKGHLYLLLAEAESQEEGVKTIEGGERIPINKDTENIREKLRQLFEMRFEGDLFSVSELDLAVLQQVEADNT